MRVVLLSETFARSMGYLENHLPRYMGRLGVDMHLVTLDLPPYYDAPEYGKIYHELTANDNLYAGLVEKNNNYTLHVVGHKKLFSYMRPAGLSAKLKELKPDIVQTMAVSGWLPLLAALWQPWLGYRLFIASHMPLAAFQISDRGVRRGSLPHLHRLLRRGAIGRFVSFFSEACYGANTDCADMAVKYYGVAARKRKVSELGIDTDVLHPVYGERELAERRELRARFGFNDDHIVCVYTGRFFQQKNPILLAQAIGRLIGRGEPYRGLFVGEGTQREAIAACSGCAVQPFVPSRELRRYYQAADLAVWPSGQSMSVLDAAACGIPVIVPDSTLSKERYEGHGRTYRENDLDDLVQALLSFKDPVLRRELGQRGAAQMSGEFGWEAIARQRLRDYEEALRLNRGSRKALITPATGSEG